MIDYGHKTNMIVGQKNYYQGRQSSDPQLVEKLLQQRSVSKERAESLLLVRPTGIEFIRERLNNERKLTMTSNWRFVFTIG
jgi:hypothetical protein